MKLFRRKTPRDMYLSMRERLNSELRDRDSELRQLFARVARGEAKNFFALHVGTELEKFEGELQTRAERTLAGLGSARIGPAPCLDAVCDLCEHYFPGRYTRSVDEHAEQAITMTAEQHMVANKAICEALDRNHGPFEAKPLCLTGVCPQRFATCTDCTIPNKENL